MIACNTLFIAIMQQSDSHISHNPVEFFHNLYASQEREISPLHRLGHTTKAQTMPYRIYLKEETHFNIRNFINLCVQSESKQPQSRKKPTM
jgi:hypothetical protein